MARTKQYFTFREELYRTHWMFSKVSKHPVLRRLRTIMWNALPFQFDPQVSEDTMKEWSIMFTRNATRELEHDHMKISMRDEYHESQYWHMPACIVWAETTEVHGRRLGMLYTHSSHTTTAIGDDTYLEGLDANTSTQQGTVIYFIESGGTITTVGGRFAAGDALQAMTQVKPERYDNTLMFTTLANGCNNVDELMESIDMLSTPEVFYGMPRETRTRMAVLGSSLTLPFLKVFNATKITTSVPAPKGYTSTNEFSGDKFPLLEDKLIKHDIGLRSGIKIRYQADAGHSTGRRHAYHELAGFWRTRKNGQLLPRDQWIWVKAHSRGDPSLGMSKRMYEKMKT